MNGVPLDFAKCRFPDACAPSIMDSTLDMEVMVSNNAFGCTASTQLSTFAKSFATSMGRMQRAIIWVELHLHLDGAARYSTLLDLAKGKSIDLHGIATEDALKDLLQTKEPAHLGHVLEAFHVFMPCLLGDQDAVERIAYELCEDQAKCNVVYFEARYSPHFLCNTDRVASEYMRLPPFREKGEVHPKDVVEAVCRGFQRGEKDFGVKARSILCCIRGHPDWNHEILELVAVSSMKHCEVVGIDVAGCAHGAVEEFEPTVIEVFQEAEKRGIHRTVHAGESGGPNEVKLAIESMKAERIGHGYRIMMDESVYRTYALDSRKIHFEAAPLSSVITGATPLNWDKHPIKRWAADDVNFSLSTDDPTCFGNTMMSEVKLAHEKMAFTLRQMWQCQLNAAHASFLPQDEKEQLLSLLKSKAPKLD